MIKVAQCWDDGVATDIRLTDIFRKYHAKATFNLCPGGMTPETIPPTWRPLDYPNWSHKGFWGGRVGTNDLRRIYGDFQVASHCMNHEVAGSCDTKVFEAAAVGARKFLEDTFQRECPGFAWPCGGVTDDAIKALRDNGFAYARTVANTDNVAKSIAENPFRLASNCHYQDCCFWKKFQQAKQDGIGCFYFWGHSYEMFDSEGLWAQLEMKIAALSADPDVVWVDVIDLVR